MAGLSEADDIALLRYIIGYNKTHGFMPTIREMMAEFGLNSPSPISRRLGRIVNMTYIQRTPHLARAMRVTSRGRLAIKQHEEAIVQATINMRVAHETQEQ